MCFAVIVDDVQGGIEESGLHFSEVPPEEVEDIKAVLQARSVWKCARKQFSSGISVIIVQQSTQPLSAFESALTRKGSEFRPDDLVLQPLMVLFSVIMGHELRGRPEEAGLPDQNHPV